MNPEIMKGQIRSLIIAVGGFVAGWFAFKGWITTEQLSSLLSSPVAGAVASMAAAFIWSAMTHRQGNAVAVVDAMAKDPTSPVKGVILEPTTEGRALAASIPGVTAVVAGTPMAAAIATR